MDIEISEGERKEQILDLDRSDFYIHMLEHIFLRSSLNVEIHEDRKTERPGFLIGKEINKFVRLESVEAVGIIDESFCTIKMKKGRGSFVNSKEEVLDTLQGRVEDSNTGEMMSLYGEIGEGLGFSVRTGLVSASDPHHVWEAIFRGLGFAIGKLKNKTPVYMELRGIGEKETRETGARVEIELGKKGVDYEGDNASQMNEVLRALSEGMNCRITASYTAKRLKSSHACLEDVGYAFGSALKSMLEKGIEEGIETYGDCIGKDFACAASYEGRPAFYTNLDFSRADVLGGKREDIDDFLMGLCFGSGLTLHARSEEGKKKMDDARMREMLACVGSALGNLFIENPFRKGVIAAAKETPK